MPILNSCCKCGSLKTGTIIIGAVGILSAIIYLIVVLLAKVRVKVIVIEDLSPLAVKIILSINLIMMVLISVLLIVGAVKRNTWCMLPWIVISIISVAGTTVSIIYTAIIFFINHDAFSGSFMLVSGLLFVALEIYLWLVVFSFYQLVKEEKNRGPYAPPS